MWFQKIVDKKLTTMGTWKKAILDAGKLSNKKLFANFLTFQKVSTRKLFDSFLTDQKCDWQFLTLQKSVYQKSVGQFFDQLKTWLTIFEFQKKCLPEKCLTVFWPPKKVADNFLTDKNVMTKKKIWLFFDHPKVTLSKWSKYAAMSKMRKKVFWNYLCKYDQVDFCIESLKTTKSFDLGF